MKQLKFIFIIIYGLFTSTIHLSAQDIVRGAIDFGSGTVKIQMVEFNTEENRIGEVLLAKYVPLSLTEDVATHNGYISEEMAQKAINILHGFKEEALNAADRKGHREAQFTGVATAVFRKAHNGNDLLNLFQEKLGIRFQILPQEEEAKLGFFTAQALYQDIPEEHLLAWDSGNDSFQITAINGDHYQICQGQLGHGTVRVILSKEMRQGSVLQTHESGNPILKNEAMELAKRIKELLPMNSDWLKEKLNSENIIVATFGEGESIFSVTAQAIAYLEGKDEPVQQAQISFTDVQRVIDIFIEQEDEVFIAADLHCKTLSSAIHLAAMMEHFDIHTIHYKRAIGNTLGMIIAPQLWLENAL